MQLADRPLRHKRMPLSRLRVGGSWLRLLLVLAWMVAAMAVPLNVRACSCAFLGYSEAIGQSDVAFIGDVIDSTMIPDDGFADDVMPEAEFAFAVERAREPMDERVVITAATGEGGSCGLGLVEGQRWLIIAHIEHGKPRTNLCTGSVEYEGLPEENRREVDAILTVSPTASRPMPEEPLVPLPVIAVGGVALVLGLASVVAFRQRPT